MGKFNGRETRSYEEGTNVDEASFKYPDYIAQWAVNKQPANTRYCAREWDDDILVFEEGSWTFGQELAEDSAKFSLSSIPFEEFESLMSVDEDSVVSRPIWNISDKPLDDDENSTV